ncbi:MAG: hypothetical protein M5R36_28710 [Deltaproteobacteria bacterium]|nr:hypothetical protein [Deltaproteobacteria bacterium]
MKSVYTLGILLLLATMTAALGCTCGGDDDDDDSDSTWSDDDDTEADDDAYSDPCAHGPVFDFDLYGTPATVPYPNDLYTVPDPDSPTGHRVNIGVDTTRPIAPFAEIEQFDFLIGAVNNLDGFSVAADLYVPVTDEPLESTLPDEVDPGVGDGVVIMVSDPGSPFDGEFAPATAWWKKEEYPAAPVSAAARAHALRHRRDADPPAEERHVLSSLHRDARCADAVFPQRPRSRRRTVFRRHRAPGSDGP